MTPAPAPVTVQTWPLAGPDDGCPAELYAVVRAGAVRRDRDGIELGEAASVTGDTYFGRFPATYWQRWTAVREVRVRLTADGEGTVRLCAGDLDGVPRTVDSVRVGAAGEFRLDAALDRFADGGQLWIEAETGLGQRLRLGGVRWEVPGDRPARRTTVVVCTTDRVEDCLRTLTALAEDPAAGPVVDAVRVVDHGRDRVDRHPGFARVSQLLGDRLHHLAQTNLGGAGGFTRGLFEADRAGVPSDFLLMDDDVLLEPDLLLRMTGFARFTERPVILGGQMLNLLHPGRLHAGAEHTDLDGIRPGVPAPHSAHAADLLGPAAREPGRAARQDRRVEAGYNGWWACLLPAEAVAEVGYPLPLFFQGDDAEFSYRAGRRGIPTVALPGAGLWHTDFPWKDDDEVNRYFIVRNYTVISALHGTFDRSRLLRVLAAELVPALLGHQYGRAATVLRAVEDFLAGPAVLDDGGPAALAALRELRAGFPETACLDFPALADLGHHATALAVPGRPPRFPRGAALLRLAAALLGRGPAGDAAAVAHDEAHWWHVARFRTALVTDASQRGVRLRRWDRALLRRLAGRSAVVLARLLWSGPRVRREFRAALPRLSSRENWARLYAEPAAAAPATAPVAAPAAAVRAEAGR
ncbi:glycosyltransferase [Kitasatospora phosalacinea]|uniref:glycosyltransferase n=1 Tax=Kitasatospora phosalacinea TaxID=2065 RepID=UPI003658D431